MVKKYKDGRKSEKGSGRRIARSGLGTPWKFWGWILEMVGFGEERDLSRLECHKVHPPEHLLSLGGVDLVIWRSTVKVGDWRWANLVGREVNMYDIMAHSSPSRAWVVACCICTILRNR